MDTDPEDDKIIAALKHTLQHISLHQSKVKDINHELKEAKQALEQEKDKYVHKCSELKKQIEHLHNELNHFKSLSKEQYSKISELEIKCAKETRQNTALHHQLQEKDLIDIIKDIKLESDSESHCTVNQLQNDNEILQKQISILQNENEELKQTIENIYKTKEEHVTETLTQQYTELKQSEKDTTNYSERISNIKQYISDTRSQITQQQQTFNTEFKETFKKINMLSVQKKQNKQLQTEANKLKMKEALKINLESVKDTKVSLNELRRGIENELMSFDRNIKSVQRAIFKQKSMIHQEITKEKDKTAKLTECLIENEQNMEQKLKEYLKQKDELQGKISNLETFLKDKHSKDIVTEMKRFRSAAIVTSITCLSEDGDNSISYHRLSEHERKAISLTSKFEKKINGDININEKVDEFIRSGGLKRYPILEQQFQYEPNDINKNRFKFGSKYICISYNMKHNELYVMNDDDNTQLLRHWINKNGANEMRKLLAKVSQRKKRKHGFQ